MGSDRLPRKLAAILYADVAGYSRLTGDDEDATHRRLSEYLDLITASVESNGGRVMHYAGDAVLAMFEAVVDSVNCATEVQRTLQARNTDLPCESRVEFRIGVNSGDVIEDRGDIYGDGVNVAARLENLADPGGICVSDSIRTAVGSKLDLRFEDLGEQEVKNIAEPVRAYKVVLGEGETRSTAPHPAALVLPDKPSIAVLPFTNMSGDPEQEYFGDGITEDIITALSRFREIFVIARNSSFTFKGQSVDVVDIAGKLGVQYVVEGSVRKAGNRVRITAQLIDASTGDHVWANLFDRDLEDVFAVQDEVCETIVATLAGRILELDAEHARKKRPTSLTAYDCLIRGRELLYRYSQEDVGQAREMFEEALALNNDYAAAYAALAQTYWADWHFGWSENPDESFKRFSEAAEKAVSLDDGDSQTQMEKGVLETFQRHYRQARFHLDKAISLNPNEPDALMYKSWYAMFAGNPEDAEELLSRAQRLDPFGRYGFILGLVHYLAKNYDEAIVSLNTVRVRVPTVHAWLAASHAQSGNLEDARTSATKFIETIDAELEKTDAPRPKSWLGWFAERLPYENEADLEHVLDGMRKAGIE